LNKAESQLGWYLNGGTGASHDLSSFGTPTDKANAGLGLEKTFGFGGRVNVDGTYVYQDSEFTISPQIPNPYASTNFDIKYIHPLGRGAGNPVYQRGVEDAKAVKIISQANWQENRDEISKQIIDLFFGLAKTNAQIANTELAINRAKRLKAYTSKNIKLGVSEKKDMLQAEARLRSSVADKRSLQVIKERQHIALNRVSAFPWDLRTKLATNITIKNIKPGDFDELFDQVKNYSGSLKRSKANITIAESIIERSRDLNRDDFNLTLSAGSRNRNGQVSDGDFNQSDYAAGIQLEYRRALDRQGLEGELTQAQINRSIGYQEIRAITLDLGYQLSTLLSEIQETKISLANSKKRLQAENKKIDEATKRYRNGRADTAELLLFESDLRFAEFTVANKKLELKRISARFDLLTGGLWQRINASNEPVGGLGK
ncbi:MAG: TolC family protein, partial [Acidiferrobacterales bacterium]